MDKSERVNHFIKRANHKYGDKFNYDHINYTNAKTPVTIICPEHGEFEQTPNGHLNSSYGCQKCGSIESTKTLIQNKVSDSRTFISKASRIHNNFYTYDRVAYIKSKTPVEIDCPIHGTFVQLPNTHLLGKGCGECNRISKIIPYDEFVHRSNQIHENLYTYVRESYSGIHNPTTIVCKTHGSFTQTPHTHLKGHGCVKCFRGGRTSKQEKELFEWVVSVSKYEVIQHYIMSDGKEVDIYIPEIKLGIEFNGVYYHSDKFKTKDYHLNKTTQCDIQGIRLIHIFCTEWAQSKCKVKSIISRSLGMCDVIFGRRCCIQEVNPATTKMFINKNHLQNYTPSKLNLGLYFEGELVQIMTLGVSRFNKKFEWEIIRMCQDGGVHIIGGYEKLFKHFVNKYNPKSVISYCDKRWFKGGNYKNMGFTLSHTSKPNYFYFKGYDSGSIALESRNKYQKHKLSTKLEKFDPELTEYVNMCNNKYHRIWDCGNTVWIWDRND